MSYVLEHFNANQLDNVPININKILSKDDPDSRGSNDDFRKFFSRKTYHRT